MERVLRDTRAKVFATFIGEDGAAADVTTPTVTIVRDSTGADLVTAAAASDESATGQVSFTLTPAQIPDLELLRATWSGTLDGSTVDVRTEIEVVGGFLCSLEVITEGADAAAKRRARERAERKLEDACRVAFRPRYAREVHSAEGRRTLLLDRPRALAVRSISVDDVALSAAELDEVDVDGVGALYREAGWPCGDRNILVVYEHGWPVTPEPVADAAAQLANAYAEGTGGSDRVTRFREDDQEFWLTVGGVAGAETSLPEVNAVIADYRYPVAG